MAQRPASSAPSPTPASAQAQEEEEESEEDEDEDPAATAAMFELMRAQERARQARRVATGAAVAGAVVGAAVAGGGTKMGARTVNDVSAFIGQKLLMVRLLALVFYFMDADGRGCLAPRARVCGNACIPGRV